MVAGMLALVGAATWLVALFAPAVKDGNGVGFTVGATGGTAYTVIVLAGLCAAAALLLLPRTRESIGSGFLIGVSTGTVSFVVFGLVLPSALPQILGDGSSVSYGYYLSWVSTVVVLAAVAVCLRSLPPGVRLQRPSRRDGWPSWTVFVLGLVSAVSLVVQVAQAGTLGHERPYDASVDLPTVITDALMLVIVAVLASSASPRFFGASMLGGWLVAAAAMLAYYVDVLSVPTAAVVAMAAVGIAFARRRPNDAPEPGSPPPSD